MPEPQVKRIRDWLREEPGREFIDWLSQVAAVKTAEAGNALVEAEMANEVEAKNLAEDARLYVAFHTLISGVMLGSIRLDTADLKFKPLSEEDNGDNN